MSVKLKWTIQALVLTKGNYILKEGLSVLFTYLTCVYMYQRVIFVYRNNQKVDFCIILALYADTDGRYLFFCSQGCLSGKVFTAANGFWKLSGFNCFKLNPPTQVIEPLPAKQRDSIVSSILTNIN